jgi:hypothetical protein
MKRRFSALSPFIALLLLCCGGATARDLRASLQSKAALPVVFVENKGQVIDENHQVRTDVDCRMSAPGMDIFFGKGQIHYQWKRMLGDDMETYRMDVILDGADMNTPAIKEEQQRYVESYYLPQCPNGLTVNTYKKIVYRNIYPGIDWVLFAGDGKLKYNFIIHPGGKAENIKLRYLNATLSLDEKGLTATTPFGSITEETPYSYLEETGKEIPSSFALNGNILQFNVTEPTQTLVIDPSIRWATYFGTSSYVAGYAVAGDRHGNSFLGGTTNQAIATIFNAYQYYYGGNASGNGGNSDGYITKFDDTCARIWTTFYGGESTDIVMGLGCDSNDYLYVMGQTYSMDSTVISSVGCYQRQNGGSPFNGQNPADVFLAKFNTSFSGTRVWATYYGGSNADMPNAFAVASDGTMVIGGLTGSTNNLASNGAFKTTPDQGFIAKFNSDGSRAWGTYYVGEVRGVAMDSSESVYVGGQANSYSNTATTGAYQYLHGGGLSDGYVAKFNPYGTRVWGTYYGDTGIDVVTAVGCDVYGNLYVGGQTNSGIGIATPGAYKSNYTAANDAFVARFTTSDGVRRWATYLGTNGNESITDIVCDSSTKVWVIGNASSTSGFTTAGAYKTSYSGPPPGLAGPDFFGDAFLAKFTLPGGLKYCTYFGGTEVERNLNAYYTNGVVYFGGTTESVLGGCSTSKGWQGPPWGGGPGQPPPPFPVSFLVKMDADTALYFRKRFTDTVLCIGDVKQVAVGVINPFRASNVFRVLLSDSGGNFANSTIVGTSNTSGTGNISFTIPQNTIPGTHYRIRVVASAPADTTFFDNGIDIRISTYPDPKVMLTGAVCAGGVVDIIDTGVSPLTTVFSWLGPNNITAAGINLHHTNVQFADSGYYILIANNYGCIRRDSVHIVPNPNPVSPSIHSNSPVCTGDTLHVWGTTFTSPVEWYWFKPAGYFPNAPADTFIYATALTDAGVYKAQAVYNGCFSPMDSVVVVVNQSVIPTVSIVANPGASAAPGITVAFTGTVTNQGIAPTYQWTNKGIYIPGATGTTYSGKMAIDFHTGDTICLVMTSNATCPKPATVSSCLGIFVDVGVDKMENDVLQLYPNPNDGQFIISAKTNGILSVNNIQGQQIARYNINTGKTNITMPKSASAGVYLGCFVQDNGNASMVKIVIE